jgi:glycosyltransferase involved in cell wall biosynthesis
MPKLRVLMVSEDIPAPQLGGLGKHAVTLGNRLLDLGHEVALMGRSERNYAASESEVGFRGRFIAGFDLSRSGWKEQQLGVWMPFKRPSMAGWIASAIARHAPAYDVVHYHGHLPMVGRSLPASINFVQTRHDHGSDCITQIRFVDGAPCASTRAADCADCAHRGAGLLRRAVSALAVAQVRRQVADTFETRKTIFVSDFLRRQFLRAVPGAATPHASVIHNFIDLRRLRAASQDAGPVQEGSVVITGRIYPPKGQQAFVEAIIDRLPAHATLKLIGDGPDREALEHRYGGARVRFLGYQPYEQVIRHTAAAHVCAVPSLWHEPCATTILEALALGRPCVTLRRGGSPELVVHERWPGQLALGASVAEAADLVLDKLRSPLRPAAVADTFGADIDAMLPAILAVYAQKLH